MKKRKYKHNERKRRSLNRAHRAHASYEKSRRERMAEEFFRFLTGGGKDPMTKIERLMLDLVKRFSGVQNVRKENVRSIPKDGVDYGATSSDKG